VVTARFDPYNRVFIAAGNFYGDITGTYEGACIGPAASVPGGTRPGSSWVTAATTAAVPLQTLLANSRGWVRMDGTPFADLPGDLFNGRVFAPPLYGSNGAVLNTLYWTGLESDAGVGTNCMGWSSNISMNEGRLGYSLNEAAWFFGGNQTCDTTASILCLEIGGRAPMVVPTRPAGSKLAFVTVGTIVGTASPSTADALCNAEAGGGTAFAAMRVTSSTAGAHAYDAVRLDGGTWYRPDGVRLYVQATDLASAMHQPLAGISRFLDGGIIASTELAWTGSQPDNGYVASFTCNGWSGSGTTGMTGSPGVAGSSTFQLFQHACTEPHHLYCFEK
jgi:hypothetical protein